MGDCKGELDYHYAFCEGRSVFSADANIASSPNESPSDDRRTTPQVKLRRFQERFCDSARSTGFVLVGVELMSPSPEKASCQLETNRVLVDAFEGVFRWRNGPRAFWSENATFLNRHKPMLSSDNRRKTKGWELACASISSRKSSKLC